MCKTLAAETPALAEIRGIVNAELPPRDRALIHLVYSCGLNLTEAGKRLVLQR